MLTEETVIDRIEIVEGGFVNVRRATHLLRDGVRTTHPPTYHRVCYDVGDDLSHEDPHVQAIAATAWTDEVKAAAAARRSVALHRLVAQQQENTNGET